MSVTLAVLLCLGMAAGAVAGAWRLWRRRRLAIGRGSGERSEGRERELAGDPVDDERTAYLSMEEMGVGYEQLGVGASDQGAASDPTEFIAAEDLPFMRKRD